jgi:pimeloyl-ACP methyl ester carboxylesterase
MPTYEEVYTRAKRILKNDPYNSPNDEVFVIYQARGPSRTPVHDEIFTYKTWWHMMGPEAHAAMAHKQIGKVKIPVLLIRGENDPLIEPWEGEALRRIAHEAGNSQVIVKTISQAGHDCMDNPEAMVSEIVRMVFSVNYS